MLRPGSTRGELISSELVPLLDSCKFLEQSAAKILAPRALGRRGQPAWLWGVESTVYREALGRVLILSPSNYPLFLPFVQALHAWAAGNVVWLKSAPGSLALHQRIRELFLSVGGKEDIFRLLGEDNSAYTSSLTSINKVVLVGSAETGSVVLKQAGEALVPAVAELSGWDTVFIHPEADLQKAALAVAFGLSLNEGKTCLAPRRIFFQGRLDLFEEHYLRAISQRGKAPLSDKEAALVKEMADCGARPLQREAGCGPVLISRVAGDNRLLFEESFGAVAVLTVVESDEQALRLAAACPYALGASLFGPIEWCRELAHKVPAQMVSINDMIVPTADPRVPFGGSGRSGFGRTRGAEGLLEMTQTRTLCERRGGSLDYLLAPGPLDDLIVEKFFLMTHSEGALQKAKALVQMVAGIARERVRNRRLKRRRPQA